MRSNKLNKRWTQFPGNLFHPPISPSHLLWGCGQSRSRPSWDTSPCGPTITHTHVPRYRAEKAGEGISGWISQRSRAVGNAAFGRDFQPKGKGNPKTWNISLKWFTYVRFFLIATKVLVGQGLLLLKVSWSTGTFSAAFMWKCHSPREFSFGPRFVVSDTSGLTSENQTKENQTTDTNWSH